MSKYIDAEELFKRLNTKKFPAEKTTMRRVTYNGAISDACWEIARMPAADVAEVRHGRWLAYAEDFDGFARCSVCGKGETMFGEQWNYCPNCGASMMDEVEE